LYKKASIRKNGGLLFFLYIIFFLEYHSKIKDAPSFIVGFKKYLPQMEKVPL